MLTLIFYAVEADHRSGECDRYLEPQSLLYARLALDKLNGACEALRRGEDKEQSTSFLFWSVVGFWSCYCSLTFLKVYPI